MSGLSVACTMKHKDMKASHELEEHLAIHSSVWHATQPTQTPVWRRYVSPTCLIYHTCMANIPWTRVYAFMPDEQGTKEPERYTPLSLAPKPNSIFRCVSGPETSPSLYFFLESRPDPELIDTKIGQNDQVLQKLWHPAALTQVTLQSQA